MDADKSSLVVNLPRQVDRAISHFRGQNIACEEVVAPSGTAPRGGASSPAPIVLYQKIGHGCLELYPLAPAGDSKEVKDFVSQWSKHAAKFSSVRIANQSVPMPDALSLCALLIWKPAKLTEPVLRVLYPGNLHQGRIFENLEKMVKSLDCLRHPVYKVSEAQSSSVQCSVIRQTVTDQLVSKARTVRCVCDQFR